MKRILMSSAILATVVALTLAANVSAGGSIVLSTSQGKIQGNAITLPVTNNSMSVVTVDVVALFDDGLEVHTGTTTVTLAAKGTQLVTVPVMTITDDIDPQTMVEQGTSPIYGTIVMNAS